VDLPSYTPAEVVAAQSSILVAALAVHLVLVGEAVVEVLHEIIVHNPAQLHMLEPMD
jgi:hypothetical protein